MRRFRGGWGKVGGFLLCLVALLVLGFSLFAGTDLLSGAGDDRAERAVEPTGSKKSPPEAADKPVEKAKKDEKKDDKEDKKDDKEDKKGQPEKKQSEDKKQKEEAAPEGFAAAAAPADTTMTLEIPKIGVSVAVYPSASESALYAGTGHVNGTGYPWIPNSNTYVAGHRIGFPGTGSDYVFWDLPALVEGDEVYLTDTNGRTYTYAVSEILEVPITDLSVTAPVPGRDVVSLQTCIENYGDYWTEGPNWYVRYVVRADRIA
jgi:sortase A